MKPRANEWTRWLAALALGACVSACQKRPPAPAAGAPAPAAEAPKTVVAAAPQKRPRLKEDPVAGKKSSLQWQEHLDHEEEERQMIFDHQRLAQHRAVIKLITAARARYDRARTKAAVDKVRAEMPDRIAEIKKRITELDHWGNNSRLLPDYAALLAALGAGYADAKTAQTEGHSDALSAARGDFDEHMKKMDVWLERVERFEEEEEGEKAERGEGAR